MAAPVMKQHGVVGRLWVRRRELRWETSKAFSLDSVRCEMPESFVDLVIVDGRPAMRGECDLASAEMIERWLASFDGDPLEVDLSGVTFEGISPHG